jgi:hypothetical protein
VLLFVIVYLLPLLISVIRYTLVRAQQIIRYNRVIEKTQYIKVIHKITFIQLILLVLITIPTSEMSRAQTQIMVIWSLLILQLVWGTLDMWTVEWTYFSLLSVTYYLNRFPENSRRHGGSLNSALLRTGRHLLLLLAQELMSLHVIYSMLFISPRELRL